MVYKVWVEQVTNGALAMRALKSFPVQYWVGSSTSLGVKCPTSNELSSCIFMQYVQVIYAEPEAL
jgi:hypothetical protein